jgi:hypothetical protein
MAAAFQKRDNIAWHSVEGASPVLDSAEKWRENVKPIGIEYELEDISKQDRNHFFVNNTHPKTTVALRD